MTAEPNFDLALPATAADVDRIMGNISTIKNPKEAARRLTELRTAVMGAIALGSWRDPPASLCRAALKKSSLA